MLNFINFINFLKIPIISLNYNFLKTNADYPIFVLNKSFFQKTLLTNLICNFYIKGYKNQTIQKRW